MLKKKRYIALAIVAVAAMVLLNLPAPTIPIDPCKAERLNPRRQTQLQMVYLLHLATKHFRLFKSM